MRPGGRRVLRLGHVPELRQLLLAALGPGDARLSSKPSFEAYRAPTEHPLAIVFGAALSLLGEGADRVMVLITLFAFVALAAGTYRLGRLCFTPFVGALAAFLVLTRFDFPSLAVRGYIDIPFMATIVWAGALEVARPRRGTVVFLLLAAAGLMRPEAWILSGVYFLWMSWDATWARALPLRGADRDRPGAVGRDRLRRHRRPAVLAHLDPGPGRRAAAHEVGRRRAVGAARLPARRPSRRRSTSPACSASRSRSGSSRCARSCRWCCSWRARSPSWRPGSAGLSVIVRYLLVPSVMMTPVRRRHARRLDDAAARLAPAPGVGGWARWRSRSSASPTRPCNPPSLERFDNELVVPRRAGPQPAPAARRRSAVERGLRCGAVSVPTHKLIPDTRWILDLPRERRGRALRPVGGVAAQGALRSRALPDRAHEHPAHRLRRQHGRDHAGARRPASSGSRPTSYFAAYLRCPPGRA